MLKRQRTVLILENVHLHESRRGAYHQGQFSGDPVDWLANLERSADCDVRNGMAERSH